MGLIRFITEIGERGISTEIKQSDYAHAIDHFIELKLVHYVHYYVTRGESSRFFPRVSLLPERQDFARGCVYCPREAGRKKNLRGESKSGNVHQAIMRKFARRFAISNFAMRSTAYIFNDARQLLI